MIFKLQFFVKLAVLKSEELLFGRNKSKSFNTFVNFVPNLFIINFKFELATIFQVEEKFADSLICGMSNMFLYSIDFTDGKKVELITSERSEANFVIGQNEECFFIVFLSCFVGKVSVLGQYYYFPFHQIILY